MPPTPPTPSPIQPGLPAPKWEDATTTFDQRCAFVSIWGPESSGKTSLALSAPGPSALIHSAEKIAGVVQPFVAQGKKIRMHNFGFTATKDEASTAERARTVWKAWESAYVDAMRKWAKSVILDTEPDAWMLRRFARFGTLTPQGDLRDLYNAVNFDWRQLLKNTYRELVTTRKVNLITIHTSKDEYKDVMKKNSAGVMKKVSERTGKQQREGHKGIAYWADVILNTYKGLDDLEYHVVINKGWFRGECEGVDLTAELMKSLGYSGLNLPAILAFITETPELEWTK